MSRLQPVTDEEAFAHQISDLTRVLSAHAHGGFTESFRQTLIMVEMQIHAYRVRAGLPATRFDSLCRDVSEWAVKTFPGSTDEARIAHLAEEVEELRAEPHSAEEMADLLLILIHHAHHHDVDLLDAAAGKFETVKDREWEPPDSRGVVKHRKD